MHIPEPANAWIFREGTEEVETGGLVERCAALLRRFAYSSEATLDLLLAAGELECALADNGDGSSIRASRITDACAQALLGDELADRACLDRDLQLVAQEMQERKARISPPEGFAYYALHPLQFAISPLAGLPPGCATVIGIRTIGTVLSAVVTAWLTRSGWKASRFTVRPKGHPYDRRLEFTPEATQGIASALEKGSQFVIVDEGPGLSGSSFLSVGEALEQLGVDAQCITFLGSRPVDAGQLKAQDAERRWGRFRWKCAPFRFQLQGNEINWSQGIWRKSLFAEESDWPACWTQMERLKFLRQKNARFLKFEGFARFGSLVRERAKQVSTAGFGPYIEYAGDGISEYELLGGRPLRKADLDRQVLDRIASYCAFRARNCRSRTTGNPQLIADMAAFNCQNELGIDPELDGDAFHPRDSIVADGRMQPYEWMAAGNENILKVDASSHGDDHFFPGPTDIAWDLAGAITEWDMGRDAIEYLVARYRQLTGDDSRKRLPEFLIAYSVFRLAFCQMAAVSTELPAEKERLLRSRDLYRARLLKSLDSRSA